MKKLIITLSLILLLSCNSSRNSSINDLINKGDLETLKKKKKEYVDLMNDLRLDLNDINNGIMLLDENEQIQVISKFNVIEKEFTTYVELQANLKSRKNVVILSEFQGALKNLFVREGDFVNYSGRYFEILTLKEPRWLFGQGENSFEIAAECVKAREGLFDGNLRKNYTFWCINTR